MDGSFSIEKARETGAVDLIRRHKETIRTVKDKDGRTETTKTVEVEILHNQDGRREVAAYLGVDKISTPTPVTTEQKARELYRRAIEVLGFTREEAMEGVAMLYPELDVKQLLPESV